jgi:hypothetical protein
MAKINVPKPPSKAFNPKRPASDLLLSQVEHLEWAVRHAGERKPDDRTRRALKKRKAFGTGYKVKPVKTEADAAARMAKLIPALASAARLPFATSQIPDDDTPATPRRTSKGSKRPGAGRRKGRAKR